jgi:5'-nucleotidase / UDP-sugar diphosphatase
MAGGGRQPAVVDSRPVCYTINMKTNKAYLFVLIALLPWGLSADPAGPPDLVVLHTNDLHGRIEVSQDLLGMPLIKAIVDDYRGQYGNVLVLDAGDTLHGRPIANQLNGRSVVETMNAAGYDVMTTGNHDFNFGYQRLLELEEMMQFDLVAANVYLNGEPLFQPWVIREAGDYRIGIFGLATPDTYQTTHPRNIEGIEFTDMIDAARVAVTELQAEGVDMIIALGHVGFGRNYPSTAVAEAVSGIDLFVDGHAHELLLQGEVQHGTLFVQANEYTKYLGKVEVRFSEDGPRMSASMISPADAAARGLEPNAAIQEMITAYRDEIVQRMLGTWQGD